MESSRLVAPTGPAPPTSGGDGSSLDTILNIVNIAFGAGMLGLPYAIQGSGFVSGIFGLGVVLFWNFVCCSLLVEVRNELIQARAQAAKVRVRTLHFKVGRCRWHPVGARGCMFCCSIRCVIDRKVGETGGLIRNHVRMLCARLGALKLTHQAPAVQNNLQQQCLARGSGTSAVQQ